MGFPILAGLEVVKGLAGLLRKKGKTSQAIENVEAAVETVKGFVGNDVALDAEASIKLRNHEEAMEAEYTKQAVAALDVMKAEASSDDAVVRRARPILMYVGYLIMVNMFIVCPLLKVKMIDYVDSQIIYWFFWMFSSGYLGYGVLRSVDKKGSAPTIFPGMMTPKK